MKDIALTAMPFLLDLGSLSLSFYHAGLLHHTELICVMSHSSTIWPLSRRKIAIPVTVPLLPRGSKAKEGSLVSSTLRHTDHHLISFGNQILNRGLPIREGGKQEHHPLLIALAPKSCSRKGIMVESIRGEYLL